MVSSFNSRTPGGVRLTPRIKPAKFASFNSRTPGGVRPSQSTASPLCLWFQFTHPGRGATILLVLIFLTLIVSIHAPREGCD